MPDDPIVLPLRNRAGEVVATALIDAADAHLARCNYWMATAMLEGKRKTIGRFDTEDEAGAAASAWRREHMPYSEEAAA